MVALALTLGLVLAACGTRQPGPGTTAPSGTTSTTDATSGGPTSSGPYGTGPTTPPTSGPTATTGRADRTVDVFTTVLRNLVGQDPAIGGAAGAKVLFVWDKLDGSVARGPMERVVGSISPEDQAAITAHMAGVVPVEFVEETEDAWNQGGSRPRDGGALVMFGPIRGTGDAVKVGLGVVCGNLCGYGTTLVLHDGSDGWSVTGTTGGSWIS